MAGERPNIFEHSDYRQFLGAYYAWAKSERKNFSHRRFSQRAGFSAPNALYLVMSGRRSLTKESIQKFALAMGLSKREQRCFEILVFFNQAKTPETKRYYLGLLQEMRQGKGGALLADHQYEYLSRWHYVVIRELVTLPHFREEPQWIRRQLGGKITAGQAMEAIEKLLAMGLVARDGQGRLVQTEAAVVTENEVARTAVYAFHQEMLSLAKEALARSRGAGHEISALTMAVSERQRREIKRMIQDFEDAVQRYLQNNPDVPKTVFQLNVQLFTVGGDVSPGAST